jgi:multidrug efflux pump subunit AcrB
MMRYLIGHESHADASTSRSLLRRITGAFERRFNLFRVGYGRWLSFALGNRRFTVVLFSGVVFCSLPLFLLVGRDFFPTVDAGLIKLHVRGPAGTRIEQTEARLSEVESTIRAIIPKHEIQTLLDNFGTPYSGLNLSLSEGALISPADGQVLISLKEGHAPTASYVHSFRAALVR